MTQPYFLPFLAFLRFFKKNFLGSLGPFSLVSKCPWHGPLLLVAPGPEILRELTCLLGFFVCGHDDCFVI